MRIHSELDSILGEGKFTSRRDVHLVIGGFDGLHRGHQQFLSSLAPVSRDRIRKVVLTFDRPPKAVLGGDDFRGFILSPRDRIRIFSRFSLDHLFILPFTEEFSRIKYQDFVADVLEPYLRPAIISVGFNFRFGNRREGSAELLREHYRQRGVGVEIVPPLRENGVGEVISASLIRQRIAVGEVEQVPPLLGRPFHWRGEVVRGEGRGAKLGFPTANVRPASEELIAPPDGVYAGFSWLLGRPVAGVANLGSNPTFGENRRKFEIYFPDYCGNLYGREISFYFCRRLRPVLAFEGPGALIQRIQGDLEELKRLPFPDEEWRGRMQRLEEGGHDR